MEVFTLGITLLLAIIFYFVGSKRKIGGVWSAVLVFFLGLIGVIIVLFSKKDDGITFNEEDKK